MSDMSDQARTIIFILIAVVILFAWSHFFMPTPPPQKPGQTTTQKAPAQTPGPKPTGGEPSAAARPAPAPPAPIPAIQATSEKIVVVESPLYRIELSNKGGVVRSWQLKKYFDDQKPPRPLNLVDSDAGQQLGWPLSLHLSDAQQEEQANTELYEVTPSSENVTAPAEIAFHWSDGHLAVTKKLKFEQGYEMSVETSVTLDGKPLPAALAWRGEFGDRSVYKASERISVFYKQGGKLKRLQYKNLGVSGNQSQPLLRSGPMEFVGIEDQFFTATFLPEGTDLSLWDCETSSGPRRPNPPRKWPREPRRARRSECACT